MFAKLHYFAINKSINGGFLFNSKDTILDLLKRLLRQVLCIKPTKDMASDTSHFWWELINSN